MNLEQLQKLVQMGESDHLEFKKSTAHLQKIGETLCGFLNHKGGIVLIGVADDGKLVGQNVGDSTRQELANRLRRFEPAVLFEVMYIDLDEGHKVIAIKADPAKGGQPYTYDGSPYERIESTTALMPQERYQAMLREKLHLDNEWESHFAESVVLDDLDHNEIIRTIKKGIEFGRISPLEATENPKEVLINLDLMEGEKIRNAAVILFGKRFSAQFSQCKIRLARFKGKDRDEFIENKQVVGNAFTILQEAFFFFERHLPIASRIDFLQFQTGGFERLDEPTIPPEALREAVVNAIAHRDYSLLFGAISIAIFDDHMEIWSDGKLPHSLQISDLLKRHPSKPRNRLIANVLYIRKMIEEWGRGTLRMVKLCKESNLPSPVFSETATTFCVEFIFKKSIRPLAMTDELQESILNLLNTNELSLKEIMDHLPASHTERKIRYELHKLRNESKIISTGHGRGSKWKKIGNCSLRNP